MPPDVGSTYATMVMVPRSGVFHSFVVHARPMNSLTLSRTLETGAADSVY